MHTITIRHDTDAHGVRRASLVGDWPDETEMSEALLQERTGDFERVGRLVYFTLDNARATYVEADQQPEQWRGVVTMRKLYASRDW